MECPNCGKETLEENITVEIERYITLRIDCSDPACEYTGFKIIRQDDIIAEDWK